MKKKRIVWKVFAVIAMVALCAFVLGFATMMLWNWLVPELFAGPVISFWQALGLLLLTKLIFGFPGKHEGGFGRKHQWKEKWREKWKEKMEHMTPEEKEKMKDKINRCMGAPWSGWKKQPEEETRPEEEK